MAKEKYSLRILNKKQEYLESIIDEIKLYHINVKTFKNSDGTYNLIIQNIDKLNNLEKIIEVFRKNEINYAEVNLFISFTSENQISGFSIPAKILILVKEIVGSIDISLIFLSPDV